MRNRLAIVACFVSAILSGSPAAGQCEFTGACNTMISRSLTIEAGVCLDSETRRYHAFAVSVPAGLIIDATVQSGFFAPALQLISPANIIISSDNNPSRSSRAHVTSTPTTAGTWFVKVRNVEVGEGGPYTLVIECRKPTDPPPPPPPLALFIEPSPLTIGRSASGKYVVTSAITGDFNSEVRASVVNLPPGVTATPESFIFAAPGAGHRDVTVQTDDTVGSGRFNFSVVATAANGVVATASAQLVIDAPCAPVRIREIKHDVTVHAGQSALLSVRASGTAPFSYQWYSGFSPSTLSPVTGATDSDYETPPLSVTSEYWVRLANGCGTFDSPTITITVAPPVPKRRSVRH